MNEDILNTVKMSPEMPSSPGWLERLPRFYLPFLLLTAAAFGSQPLHGGEDFWAHAAIGRWIAQHGHVPTQTLFLWSAKQPYIAQGWLTELLFYGFLRFGGSYFGPFWAVGFTAAMSALPFALWWRFWRQDHAPSSFLVPLFLAAIWAGAARFHARPELFSALFLTLLWLFLIQWPRREDWNWLHAVWLVLMFVAWPNLHGAVVMGLILLWATVVCDLVQFPRRAFPLLATAALCTITVACNPYGFSYFQNLLQVNSSTFARIDEWKPFWKEPVLAFELVAAEILLWFVALGAWLLGREKRWAQLAWLGLMGLAFLRARRQLWLTALCSLAVLVANAEVFDSQRLWRGWRRLMDAADKTDSSGMPIPVGMRAILRGGMILMLLSGLCQAVSKDFWPPHAVSPKLPVKMASYLATKTPPGRVFNDYEFSAYLEWHLNERRLLFIDLNNAYPDKIMEDYFDIQDPINTQRLLDAKQINVVALRPRSLVQTKPKKWEGLKRLDDWLNKSPRWKRLYDGTDGTIWARKSSINTSETGK